jgi:hypothetical protein
MRGFGARRTLGPSDPKRSCVSSLSKRARCQSPPLRRE